MTNFVFLKFNVQFSVGINLNRSSPAKRLKKVKNKLLNFVIYLYEIENNVIMCVLE